VCAIVKAGGRHRYIHFILESQNVAIKRFDLGNELDRTCNLLYQTSCNALGIRLIRFDGSQGIIKCNHLEKEKTIYLLTMVKTIDTIPVSISPKGTSGTIRSLLGNLI
jgi:RNase P/RNase MRP subunit POP5